MEGEIRNMRKDLAKFTDWAKQSFEFNQRTLSIINENFNLLLKLFVSQNGRAVTLENAHCTLMTRKGGIEVESERALSSVSYQAVNDFSDDEDVEESLKLNPISLKMLPLYNSKKSTNRAMIKKRKSSLNEKPNSATDETLICSETNEKSTSETTINSKSDCSDESGRKRRRPRILLTGKKFEQHLRDLKRKRDDSRKKCPNALKLPDSYLEYGATRSWKMDQIKLKFYKDRVKAGETRKVFNVAKTTCFKDRSGDKRVFGGNQSSPALNLTPEQLEANLKALREEYGKSKIRPIPDSYFQFGAARGWSLRQVSAKFYCRNNRNKRD